MDIYPFDYNPNSLRINSGMTQKTGLYTYCSGYYLDELKLYNNMDNKMFDLLSKGLCNLRHCLLVIVTLIVS